MPAPDDEEETTDRGEPGDATARAEATGGAGAPRPAWYRRPRRLVLVAAGAVVAVGVGVFAYQWATRGAEEVAVSDRIEQYREAAGSDRPSGFLRPATGVYTYEASGSEELSVLGTTQQWGPTMPATVTRSEGCWSLRIDYSTNHWGENRYCPDGDRLLGPGTSGYQAFDFGAALIGEETSFTCDPPTEVIRVAAEPGDTWRASCDGTSESGTTSVTSAGTNTFVGIEELTVDGRSVATLHYRERRTLSGSQDGEGTTDNWYAVTDGMLIRSRRSNQVTSPSPVGDVVYREEGEFTLTSLEPSR